MTKADKCVAHTLGELQKQDSGLFQPRITDPPWMHHGLATLGLLIALAVILAIISPSVRVLPSDDAYVTFGFARNLVDGHGFVFNADQPLAERICGTTTPGFALLLAGSYAISGVQPDKCAVFLYWFFLGLLAILMSVLLGGGLPGFVGGLIVLGNPFWHLAGYGNETLVFAFGALLVLWLSQRRIGPAAFLAGALLLIRPEAVLVWPAIVLSRRDLWKKYRLHLLWFAGLILLPLTCLLLSGQILPYSILAKLHQGMQRGYGSIWQFAEILFLMAAPYFLLYGLFFAFGLPTIVRDVLARAALVWLVMHAAFLIVGHAPCYRWYLTGLIAPSSLLVPFGASNLVSLFRRHSGLLWALLSIIFAASIPWAYSVSKRNLEWRDSERGRPYAILGEALRSQFNAKDTDWLLAWEGAQVSYTARVNWTDPYSLVEKTWNDWETDRRPSTAMQRIHAVGAKFVLFYDVSLPLMHDRPFLEEFHEAMRLRTPSKDIVLFVRNE